MKTRMSEVTLDELYSLSWEQKWRLCCSGIRDDGESAEAALLLGSKPVRAVERALGAAELYRAGRAGIVIPTGGVLWAYEGERLTEAEIMTRVLVSRGVPRGAVVQENEAATTRENMIYGTLQLVRHFGRIPDSVVIVTSVTHMKRSMALAKALLPRKIRLSMYPTYPAADHETWMASEDNRRHLDDSLRFHKELVDCGDADDFEIDV